MEKIQKNKSINDQSLSKLTHLLEGEFFFDDLQRTIYATDASVYQSMPLGVAIPASIQDIQHLIHFAKENGTTLIPRAAGTSLAGQCVGDGIVVDLSKHFTNILEVNTKESWVRVQPGVVRNELNNFLKPLGYLFGPNTSTASRCMIGGMVGNNSCGTSSIVYGSTREHVHSIHAVLSDGSETVFQPIDRKSFDEKCRLDSLEGRIYKQIKEDLSNPTNQANILKHFPKPTIQRRNTGYAIDLLSKQQPFTDDGDHFNFCSLLCGSEGTLAFTTEIKLHIDPLPPVEEVVLAIHCKDVPESMLATQVAMSHHPTQCELMDKVILDCTKNNIEQRKNRFFLEGDPGALIFVEFRGDTVGEAEQKANALCVSLKGKNLGYAYPIIYAPQTKGIWSLRNAGLGLLANIPGDKKAVACIEDTAVDLNDLPEYIAEFTSIMERFGQESVYYAHAGAGELHLRPILNLKKQEDVDAFYQIAEASAKLVKKYGGSLSGEHGDGRVRAPFIPFMVGEENYQLFKKIKATWDPTGIFNPGKIVDAAPMNTSLRYVPDEPAEEIVTVMDFSSGGGFLRMAEKCNGSGDCRNPASAGGTMCPSYQATRNEKDTTRARANALRNYISHPKTKQPFDQPELKEVMDLCIGCKGCTSECPSGVDMSGMKAEFLHQYYKSNTMPLRDRFFAGDTMMNKIGFQLPMLSNLMAANPFTGSIIKNALGIAKQRTLPKIEKTTLLKWYQNRKSPEAKKKLEGKKQKTVYLFCDEFINHYDVSIGQKAVLLLEKLGYEVRLIQHVESGRAAISKGMLSKAKSLAESLVRTFSPLITNDVPLLGIEPSAILGFRDEFPRLVDLSLRKQANELKKNVFLIDEFLSQEMQSGHILSEQFQEQEKHILLHGHCHQKSLSNIADTAWMLELPKGHEVEIIPSGCCGMAGSFGYEQEHYQVSMQIGELVLFPAVRKSKDNVTIVAPGTSCRHQIFDGTARKALHPVEVLYEALIEK